jgi:hypothetical protein
MKKKFDFEFILKCTKNNYVLTTLDGRTLHVIRSPGRDGAMLEARAWTSSWDSVNIIVEEEHEKISERAGVSDATTV